MKMTGVDVIDVFGGAVSGAAYITNDVSGVNDLALCQINLVRAVLPQMGIVVISLFIKTPNTDAPAAVLIPAHHLYGAAFHRDYRSAGSGH